MAGGSRKSSQRQRRQLRIKYVENGTDEYNTEQQQHKREKSAKDQQQCRSSNHRSSRRSARVHPDPSGAGGSSSRFSTSRFVSSSSSGRSGGMVDRGDEEAKIPQQRNSGSKKKLLSVDTSHNSKQSNNTSEDERRQSTPKTSSSSTSRGVPPSPEGGLSSTAARDIRTNRDLRSPGAAQTPVAKIAKLPEGQPLPDFITQTDANGNASTPRSAKAIEGARKSGGGGRGSSRPNLRKDRRPTGDDGSESDEENGVVGGGIEVDACDTLLESFYMMCCCIGGAGGGTSIKEGRELKQGGTQDTADDKVRLLGPFHEDDQGKKCLVLDLDETLVHSSFRPVPNADFVIPVPIEDVVHFVYVMKRPGVDEFLLEMAKHYEIVIYTASLNKYADPLLDLLDPHRVIRYRLFRESCAYFEGNYVKDLSLLDRDLSETIIIDNSPSSYMFHPENAIDCSSFIDDPRDRELDQIGAFLAGIKDVTDVRGICHQWRDWPVVDIDGVTTGNKEEQQHQQAR